MRIKVLRGLVIAVSLAAAAPVMTVTNGQPDGNRHPYVGVAIQFIPVTTPVMAYCMNDQYRLKRGEIQAEKGHRGSRKLHENSTFQYFDPTGLAGQSRPATRRALVTQCLYPEDADPKIPFMTGTLRP